MGGCLSTNRDKKSEDLQFPSDLLLTHDLFETPADPLGQSGGTATFFKIIRRSSHDGSELIGKDVARSLDEVVFYATLRSLSTSQTSDSRWNSLLPFFVACEGVLQRFPCLTPGEVVQTKDLLVLERLGAGFRSPRMFDVKIGACTAVAGWRGKSRLAAWRAKRLARLTNTAIEGFRLEGADNGSGALNSLLVGNFMEKKHKRFQLQRLRGSEIFSFLVEISDFSSPDNSASWQLLTQVELVEQLHNLHKALSEISSIPQMWIGSSVALVVETEISPQEISGRARVKLFDWGRSELSVGNLSDKKFPGVEQYWREYRSGVRRLLLEAATLLRSRYGIGNFNKFPITVELWDFDVTSADDFIGQVEISVSLDQPVGSIGMSGEFPIKSRRDVLVTNSRGVQSTVRVEISDSHSSWGERTLLVKIPSARNLPQMDFPHGKADPMIRLVIGNPKTLRSSQNSKIIPDTLDPDWKENEATFVFVVNPEIHRLSSLAQKIMATEGGDGDALRDAIGSAIDS